MYSRDQLTLAQSVAAQVALLWRVRAVTAHWKLKIASEKSKGRANGSRPRAAIQG